MMVAWIILVVLYKERKGRFERYLEVKLTVFGDGLDIR